MTDKLNTLPSQKSINNELSIPIELMNRINQTERVIQKILKKIQKLESDINVTCIATEPMLFYLLDKQKYL